MDPDPDEHYHPGVEDLAWENEEVKGEKPKGLYSHASEMAQTILSGEQQCALFCGGKKCKYCKSEGWAPEELAIKGLYSHWVTDNILAMARPTNHAIKKHDLVQQFVDAGINSIVNLQIAGEHADCGPHKLDPSGFLYNPQTFMEKGVFFYNFGWPDYGVASLSTILDMVKVMQFAVSQGKVAVHCHAGRGRTGVIIACYLVFTNRISGREAIHYVREKRPGSIQTRQQMQVIEEFEQYLHPFRTVFAARHHRAGSLRQKGSHEFSLQQYLNRQRHILHGYEARRLKFVPKIIYTVCERLLELAKKGSSLQRQLEKTSRVQSQSQTDLKPTFSTISTATVKAISPELNVKQSASKDSLLRMGKRRKKPSLLSLHRSRQRSISMEDLDDDKFKSVLDEPDSERQSIGSSNSGVFTPAETDENDDDDDDKSIVWGNSVTDLKAMSNPGTSGVGKPVSPKVNGQRSSPQSEVMSQTDTEWSVDQSVATMDMSEDCVQAVACALALSDNKVPPYVSERTSSLEEALNTCDSAWTSLATEGDQHVLGLLLWDWLDQLKEPVLRVQDLHILLDWVDEPQVGLQKIEKGPRHTIEYLVKVISKLQPIKECTLLSLYEKLLSHLTHQWVVYGNGDDDDSNSWAGSTRNVAELDKDHWSEMRPQMAEKLFLFFHNLQDTLQQRHRPH